MTPQDARAHILDLGNDVVRVLAPNPSPMTLTGTNSYLIGREELVIVDPGPDSDDHLAVLVEQVRRRPVKSIVVTHSHLDHSPLASRLSDAVDAPVVAFGDSLAGRSAVMADLADAGLTGGGEGVHADFAPDHIITDGGTIDFEDRTLTAIHTPGHFGNHICLQVGADLLTGDHVMGWASSLVSPPDGDLTDFMGSCRKLLKIDVARFLPGHGAPVENPQSRLQWLITHRQTREAQILDALATGSGTVESLTEAIYHDIEAELWPAAARNVFAHLIDLTGRNKVSPKGKLGLGATFETP